MKKLMLFLLIIPAVLSQVNVQRILSEETFISDGANLKVSHILTNHREVPITDITIYEELPKNSKITDCNCEIIDNNLVLKEIPPKITYNLTYTAELPNGQHDVNLGHKTYLYMNTTQERLGKKYEINIEGSNFNYIPVIAVIIIFVLIFLYFKKFD